MEKVVFVNGEYVTLIAKKDGVCPLVYVTVNGSDGKQRRVSFEGYQFTTRVVKNGKLYGPLCCCKSLNSKTYGFDLEGVIREFFFESSAYEWKAYLEKVAADYAEKGSGLVPQPKLVAEVNEYLDRNS